MLSRFGRRFRAATLLWRKEQLYEDHRRVRAVKLLLLLLRRREPPLVLFRRNVAARAPVTCITPAARSIQRPNYASKKRSFFNPAHACRTAPRVLGIRIADAVELRAVAVRARADLLVHDIAERCICAPLGEQARDGEAAVAVAPSAAQLDHYRTFSRQPRREGLRLAMRRYLSWLRLR